MIAPHLSYAVILTIPFPHILMHIRRYSKPGMRMAVATLVYLAVLLLPLRIESNWIVLLVLAASIPVSNILVLSRIRNLHMAGSLLLLLNLAVGTAVFGRLDWISGFSEPLVSCLRRISATNLAFAAVSPAEFESFLFYTAGILLVSVGLNDPIALFLKRTHLMPGSTAVEIPRDGTPADPEPARGRVIGYLERAIILVLIFTDNIAAIGFVLAAKGFTRFKQMDDRDFAEYVLIGTLLSVGATMLTWVLLSALR